MKPTSAPVIALNFWRKNLTALPPDVFEKPELEVLNASENQLTSIPEDIGRLKNLRNLDLGHNLLTDLPESLGELASLTDYLYLHDNHRRVPARLCIKGLVIHWRPLRELRLRNTGLDEVPPPLRFLTRLNFLDLRGNPLRDVPEWINDLPELIKLDLRWTKVGHLSCLNLLSARGCRVLL